MFRLFAIARWLSADLMSNLRRSVLNANDTDRSLQMPLSGMREVPVARRIVVIGD
jgi:hypothetical protein